MTKGCVVCCTWDGEDLPELDTDEYTVIIIQCNNCKCKLKRQELNAEEED